MVFSSIEFIGIFLPVLLLVYTLAKPAYRNLVLLIGSLVFYGIGEPAYILLLLVSLFVNYGLSSWMTGEECHRKKGLAFILVWNFGILFWFKYFNFFADNINTLAGKGIIPSAQLILPLGISFYTFQIVSYQIDLFCGKQKERAGFLEFALYVCMFPQLVAGPIVQYHEIEKYLKKPAFCMENVENGLKIFTVGLGAKVLLANQIGILFNNIQGIGAGNLSMPAAWLGAFAYSFQIYFDFWGYSFMAIGLGQIFGYRLPVNFNYPYMSWSVTEFWRRWHITLSRWFREYVYIPLGGNRKGRARTCLNLFIVWSLTGLWHGASWNFVLWGMFFFVLLVFEKMGFGKFLEKHRLAGHLYCILVIPVSWIIFSQTDLSVLADYLKAMVGGNSGHVMVGAVQIFRYLKEYGLLLAACVLCSTPLPGKLFYGKKGQWLTLAVLFLIFWASIYELHMGKNNPFLYFRF